jgi:hypothetical protein
MSSVSLAVIRVRTEALLQFAIRRKDFRRYQSAQNPNDSRAEMTCHRSSEIVVFWTHAGLAAADDIVNHLGGLAVS